MNTWPTCWSRLSRPAIAAGVQPAGADEVGVPDGDAPEGVVLEDGLLEELSVDPPEDENDVAGAEAEGEGADVGALHAASVSTPPAIVTMLIITVVGICERLVTGRP